MLQCEECDLWRLLYSKRKLSTQELSELQTYIDDIAYSCGATMQESQTDFHVCLSESTIALTQLKNSYSSDFEPICIYCAAEIESCESDEFYPMCSSDKQPIRKRL